MLKPVFFNFFFTLMVMMNVRKLSRITDLYKKKTVYHSLDKNAARWYSRQGPHVLLCRP